MVALRTLGAQRHVAVQEEQGQVELRVEGEAETLLLRLCVGDREAPRRVVGDGVVCGAHCLNEGVV